jgi:hypothetical protein
MHISQDFKVRACRGRLWQYWRYERRAMSNEDFKEAFGARGKRLYRRLWLRTCTRWHAGWMGRRRTSVRICRGALGHRCGAACRSYEPARQPAPRRHPPHDFRAAAPGLRHPVYLQPRPGSLSAVCGVSLCCGPLGSQFRKTGRSISASSASSRLDIWREATGDSI